VRPARAGVDHSCGIRVSTRRTGHIEPDTFAVNTSCVPVSLPFPSPVEEVSGGCFCCKFDDLIGAMDRLMSEGHPDLLLGEPVGSCTDLSATVMQPLKALHEDRYRLAPPPCS